MIYDDCAFQVAALFFYRMLNFKYFFGFNSMLYSYVMYLTNPLVYGVGCCQRQWIIAELAKIWIYIAIVKYGVLLFPFSWVAGVVHHQYSIVNRWRRHRELMQTDGG